VAAAGGPDAAEAVAEAFRLAEALRGQSVQRALNASAARNATSIPGLAELIRRSQDAKKQVETLYGFAVNILSARPEDRDSVQLESLRTRIEALQTARQAADRQIAREYPAYGQLLNPSPGTLADVRAALKPGEALVSTLATEGRTFVWAVSREGPVAFATPPLGAEAIRSAVAGLRRALDPGARVLGDIPAFDVEAAHGLYLALLEPVKAGWSGADTLLIVPHGALGQLPFALLPTQPSRLAADEGALFSRYRGVPWLARTHATVVLPSAGALLTLRSITPAATGRRPFVGFGDPYFSVAQAREAAAEQVATRPTPGAGSGLTLRDVVVSPGAGARERRLAMLPRLPDTAEEIRVMARALGADEQRDVYLGTAANERTVNTLDLSRYRVVAFSTHGLVPRDLEGLTQPALALTAPEVAGVEGDGLLTMEKILALRLNADWVVLSACNTSNGAGTGGEALSGLGRAFFYAGARALLVTSWPVETTSARALTTELFRRQEAAPSLSRARALQQTALSLMDGPGFLESSSGRVAFSYAHPIFWAPFILVGDGG
jgi:CHAT domain-containing protein